MRKHLKTTFAIAALASGLLATATVLAHESGSQKSSMMGHEMMGQGMMDQSQMMGGGMMNMMGQMSRMMETCNEMMQSGMGGHGETNDPSPALEDKE